MGEVRPSDLSFSYIQNITSLSQTGAFGDTLTSAYSIAGWQALGRFDLSRVTSLELSHREYSLALGSSSQNASLKQSRSFSDSHAFFYYGVFGIGFSRTEVPLVSFTD